MPFQIIRNDITRTRADAIVNTANPEPMCAGGTDFAIYQAAGMYELLVERQKIGKIAPGNAVETPAFRLQAKYIIHTVGPAWIDGEHGEFDILRSCYENSLRLAQKLGCRSIAFPLIATGVYGFPKDKALQTALSVIQPFVMENDMKVILVVFDRKAFELSGSIVENVREYVDANYIREKRQEEYRIDAYGGIRPRPDRKDSAGDWIMHSRKRPKDVILSFMDVSDDSVCFGEESPEEKKEAIPEISEQAGWNEAKGRKRKDAKEKNALSLMVKPGAKPERPGQKVDIRQLISNPEKTFQEKLFEIIDSRGLTGPQVYKNYISKQVYSKIQSDRDYHPKKSTAIALCLALHLNLDETQDLLGRAGLTLSRSSIADLVISGCIRNGEYNPVRINIMLFDYNCPCLDKIK